MAVMARRTTTTPPPEDFEENIIDIDVAVFWRIRANEASKFLFNARNPEDLVFGVAESSMREVIGRTPIQPALTQLRAQIESDAITASGIGQLYLIPNV